LGARIDLAADFQVEAARELESLLTDSQQSQPKLVPRVRLALAQALIAQQRFAEGGAELRRLIAETPDALEARVRLARLELDQGHADLAVASLTQLPAAHTELGSAFDILGRAQLASGDSNAAEASFRQVVTLAPDRPEGRYGVARALLLRGESALARPLLEDNLQRFPAHRPSLLTLGELIRRGEGEKASDSFIMKYWATHSDSPEVSTLEGDWEFARRRQTRALVAYKRAITLEPDFLPAASALARFYARRKLAAQAFSVIDAALSQSPQNPKLLLLGAEIASELRDYQQARQHLDRVFAITPDYPEAVAQLARLTAESGGDLGAARKLAERAYASAPGNAEVLDALGWVSHLSNDSAKAIEQLQAAVRSEPNNANSHYHLAAAALAQGDIPLARQSLEQVFAIDPGFPDSAALRGRVPPERPAKGEPKAPLTRRGAWRDRHRARD
jgi:tetratricopeptide (TPR) repeat protein